MLERRFVPLDATEIRADGEQGVIEGHSAMFGIWTDIGPFRERVEPGAFRDTIAQDDVRALFNHDPNMVLGRTSNGTLALEERQKGLFMRATPNMDTQVGKDVTAWVKRGDIKGQSYGFTVLEDSWETKDIEGEAVEHRTVKKVKLFDVGPVTFPAEEETDVQANSAQAVYELRQKDLVAHTGGPDGDGDDVTLERDETPLMTSRGNALALRERQHLIEKEGSE